MQISKSCVFVSYLFLLFSTSVLSSQVADLQGGHSVQYLGSDELLKGQLDCNLSDINGKLNSETLEGSPKVQERRRYEQDQGFRVWEIDQLEKKILGKSYQNLSWLGEYSICKELIRNAKITEANGSLFFTMYQQTGKISESIRDIFNGVLKEQQSCVKDPKLISLSNKADQEQKRVTTFSEELISEKKIFASELYTKLIEKINVRLDGIDIFQEKQEFNITLSMILSIILVNDLLQKIESEQERLLQDKRQKLEILQKESNEVQKELEEADEKFAIKQKELEEFLRQKKELEDLARKKELEIENINMKLSLLGEK